MKNENYAHETHTFDIELSLPLKCSRNKASNKKHPYKPNWHENVEILRFVEGEGELRLNCETISVKPGDIAIVNANFLHHVMTDKSLIFDVFILDNKFCESCGIDILNIYFKDFVKDDILYKMLGDVSAAVKELKDGEERFTSKSRICHLMLGALIRMCEEHGNVDSKAYMYGMMSQKYAKAVITYVKQNLAEHITLGSLAEKMGISKYHLSHQFNVATGQTVFEYVNRVRCEEAKHLLLKGTKISEAALAVGYENLSYFTRTFKKYCGELPSEYVKRKKEKAEKNG